MKMKKQYFIFQLKYFFTNPKNIGLFVLIFILSLYFGLVSVPNRQIIEKVDPYAIKGEYQRYNLFLKKAVTKINEMQKSKNAHEVPNEGYVNALKTYPAILKFDKHRLHGIKTNNWREYAIYSSRWYKDVDHLIFVDENEQFLYPVQYYQNNNYREDGHFGYQRTAHLYDALVKSKQPLTRNTIEERTTLQILQNSISGWTALILIIIVIFFAADIVPNDRKNKSVLKNIPLSKSSILWIKTLVVEIGIGINFLLALVVITLCTAPKYGFGSFNLRTTFYMGRLYFLQPFKYPTLGEYFRQFGIFAILIVFLFIRLTILFSIIFRNEYIAEILATMFAISGKVFYFSLGMGYVYPFLQNLPMTYFSIGESLTGNLAYLMDSPGWGFVAGLYPLIFAILIVEIFMIMISHSNRVSLVKG